jgi:Fe-S oxidoreductase
MADIEKMLDNHGKDAVFHAHIGTGELHLRPVLDLKKVSDTDLFRTIGLETAMIVKKYRGSLSGEHGDGRLRGEFIPLMLGERNYALLRDVKQCWDPYGIMNPGKITDTPSMNSSLRYVPGSEIREPDTVYDFSSTGGIIRAAEKCNGSADCRKSSVIGGVMCPSFMATGDEELSTRARANLMREFLSAEGDPWDHREVYDILDLCLGCKGCKAECPSGVDIAKLKSEYLQHWYDRHGIPLRTLMIAYISTLNRLGSLVPSIYNFFLGNKFFSSLIKKLAGFAEKRSIPLLYRHTLRKWLRKNLDELNPGKPVRTVCLFVDEFTDYNDTETGMAAVRLLTALGYRVIVPGNSLSGRTFISKGLLRKAGKIARKNIKILSGIVSSDTPLLGIEPSAILGFRDEYPDLAGRDLREQAELLSRCSFMIDEFIASEYRAGRITRDQFTGEKRTVLVHGHCQQKAVASSKSTVEMLSIPAGYQVREIPSGCCGMAGSFGYEKEHFDLSNRIGEMVLFPEVRNSSHDTLIAAPGTSCRHHIKDGTGRQVMHPVEIMLDALA